MGLACSVVFRMHWGPFHLPFQGKSTPQAEKADDDWTQRTGERSVVARCPFLNHVLPVRALLEANANDQTHENNVGPAETANCYGVYIIYKLKAIRSSIKLIKICKRLS